MELWQKIILSIYILGMLPFSVYTTYIVEKRGEEIVDQLSGFFLAMVLWPLLLLISVPIWLGRKLLKYRGEKK